MKVWPSRGFFADDRFAQRIPGSRSRLCEESEEVLRRLLLTQLARRSRTQQSVFSFLLSPQQPRSLQQRQDTRGSIPPCSAARPSLLPPRWGRDEGPCASRHSSVSHVIQFANCWPWGWPSAVPHSLVASRTERTRHHHLLLPRARNAQHSRAAHTNNVLFSCCCFCCLSRKQTEAGARFRRWA
jgi:hypothetical protein